MTDWEHIRKIHAPMVWSVVARILRHRDDSLECCQDVFAEAIERGRRSPVTDWEAFLRWLATRRAIDLLRRRKLRSTIPEDVERLGGHAETAEQRASFEELVARVRSELAHLPDRQAEAFWLVCVESRTYEEVAGQMGLTANAVGVLVHRARRRLRERLAAFRPAATE